VDPRAAEDSAAADPVDPVWPLVKWREVAEDPDGDRAEGPGDEVDPSVDATCDASLGAPADVDVVVSGCGSDPEEEPVVADMA
jgi:hypothetical protein